MRGRNSEPVTRRGEPVCSPGTVNWRIMEMGFSDDRRWNWEEKSLKILIFLLRGRNKVYSSFKKKQVNGGEGVPDPERIRDSN